MKAGDLHPSKLAHEKGVNMTSFSAGDFAHFYQWLCLNEESITWQGKYRSDFKQFWQLFFSAGLTLEQIASRFAYVYEKIKVGPLHTWFRWLREQFIIYCFTHQGMSLAEIAAQSCTDPSQVATLIRSFYVERFPLAVAGLNDCFELGNIADDNLQMTRELLKKKLQVGKAAPEKDAENIMTALEITLYPEWQVLLQKMRQDFTLKAVDVERIKRKASLYNGMKFIRDVLLLLAMAALIIFLTRWGDEFYQNYLAEKIKILEPSFQWLSEDLSFKEQALGQVAKAEIISELTELERIISAQQLGRVAEEERFETESDVVISSIDGISPRPNFGDLEQSLYEESRKGVGLNFRGYRFGSNKVYRIMVKAVRPDLVKEKLRALLKKYQVAQADKVRPGTKVPGGFYYNLHVPRRYLGEFITQVAREKEAEEEAILYETKTLRRNPAGKNRVFIFVKTI